MSGLKFAKQRARVSSFNALIIAKYVLARPMLFRFLEQQKKKKTKPFLFSPCSEVVCVCVCA